MNFEYLHKIADHLVEEHGYYIRNPENFYTFADEFNIERVHWNEPTTISASYFLRLLKEGSSARAHENDEKSKEMGPFYSHLLDHGALWKCRNGNVICTALPYGTQKEIMDKFYEMIDTYSFSNDVKIKFLDEKYRLRENGDYMIIIYYDPLDEEVDLECTEEELRRRAIKQFGKGKYRNQNISVYVRDRYVSAYAKRRAHGKCQLCGNDAPFDDKDGEPYLETHHIFWLADGGEDSIENTVALCPNCHRKMHSLNLEKDVAKLYEVVSSYKIDLKKGRTT